MQIIFTAKKFKNLFLIFFKLIMHTWSVKEICELIELLKEHTYLFDTTHRDFKCRIRHDDAYKQMCLQLNKLNPNITIDDIRHQIKIMRYRYKVECAKIAKAKQEGNKYLPSLWYFELVKFFDKGIGKCINLNMHRTNKPTTLVCESIVDTNTTQPYNQTVVQRAMSSFQLANNILEKLDEPKTKHFGHFVADELHKICDPDIRSQAQWEIQEALQNALDADHNLSVESKDLSIEYLETNSDIVENESKVHKSSF